MRGEQLELLATAAEHERVAALQARHALAGQREPHEQGVDVLLLPAVAGFLADEDALRVAARALQHLRCDETVVQDDVGLLQQLQRAQGEEVRVAGTGADQVDLAERGGGARADEACGVQLAVERGARAGLIAGQHARGDGTLPPRAPRKGGAPTRAGPAARARAARP